MGARVLGSDFDEHALNRLKRDLGDAVDDARIMVRAGDLRGLLAWQEDADDAEDAEGAYDRGYKAGVEDTERVNLSGDPDAIIYDDDVAA